METGTEVLTVISAIVTAFRTAAEVLENIKDRKDKKKRKRDRDIEELLEIKILHKSLVQGEVQCRRHCENRQSRFTPAFEKGDAIALPALKDVVISLQTEVIHCLHLARAVDAATLDFTTLHDASITCRKDAIRTMDQLCQRIVNSMQYQSQGQNVQHATAWSPSVPSILSDSVSVQQSLDPGEVSAPALQLTADKRLPSLPGAIENASRVIYQPIHRVLPQRAITIRRSKDTVSQTHQSDAAPMSFTALGSKASHSKLSWVSSKNSAASAHGSSVGDSASFTQSAPTSPDISHSNSDRVSSPEATCEKNEPSDQLATSEVDPKRMSTFSIQPSVFTLGGNTDPDHSTRTSTASVLAYRDMRSRPTSEPYLSEKTDFDAHQDAGVTGCETSEDVSSQCCSNEFGAPHSNFHTQWLPSTSLHPDGVAEAHQPRHHLRPSPSLLPPQQDASPAHFTIDVGTDIDVGRYIEEQPSQDLRSLKSTRAFESPSLSIINTNDANPPPRQAIPADEVRSGVATDNDPSHTISEKLEETETQYRQTSAQSDKLDEIMFTSPQSPPPEASWEVQFTEKLRPAPDLSNEKFSASLTQADYQERLASLPKGLDNVWLPLARPALHNRYHGFCKGAWQIRRAADEGLRVLLTPSLKEPVLHWQCASCEFRSKAPHAEALPDHILFNQKYNIRYRWLFLAKSHRSALTPSDTPDNYSYGCVFCVAQGHTSAVHEKLEHLLVHIVAKHKSTMMTPEIKAKTKCVTSNIAGQKQDWDVSVPDSHVKGVGTAADELRISAGKFWNRRKAKK